MTTLTNPARVAAEPAYARPSFFRHTAYLTLRQLRAAMRVPAFIVMNVVQPLIWLLLFGQLFTSVVDIPGFTGGDNYLEFLTPGIVMMMALFGSAWAGTSYIQDMDRGVMDRFLTSPTSRGAMMVSTLVYQALLTLVQSLIVLGVAWLGGARFDGGIGGILIMLLAAMLLTASFSALSNAAALLARNQNVLIGISQLITIPLMFLSSALMDTSLSADWVAEVARFNPFEWAVVAGREALGADPDWASVWGHLGLLAVFTAVLAWVATRAFRVYQRSA
ncbi:ABC transporter permease [Agromyces cerinus]|uniref:Transport permease protein n=1 Tax=Agromyces cerinus subsp. cerinus TaxID=232089 RepID=A0A1N6F5A7_9MICO|nr:ABC transporter permease [Agromyces cerinus]SIN90396.1 ABC-2 type transport system permease protein [Agromyces cerinus subsp. cerinus]